MSVRESQIYAATRLRPDEWLNCHRVYLGEILALQCKGMIESRLQGEQLQIRSRERRSE